MVCDKRVRVFLHQNKLPKSFCFFNIRTYFLALHSKIPIPQERVTEMLTLKTRLGA